MLKFIYVFLLTFVFVCFSACSGDNNESTTPTPTPDLSISPSPEVIPTPSPTVEVTPTPIADASTATFSLGLADTIVDNLFPSGVRVAGIGEIIDESGITRTVPAEVRYTDDTMPFASDLYNRYVSGHSYANAELAVAALDAERIIDVDPGGELITAYIFADNYFEMYVNGIAVGKDPVPFTDFNSSIVQFRVNTPFVVSALLVDWEENLGTGTESGGGGGGGIQAGDAGLVVVFKNSDNQIIGITNSNWKAQTYYTAPLSDRSCLMEIGNLRDSSACGDAVSAQLDLLSAAHWDIPDAWMNEEFDDADWPNATVFDNNTVGVNNKASYTNFVDIFDDSDGDAEFIWSTNLVLDNTVIVRTTVSF